MYRAGVVEVSLHRPLLESRWRDMNRGAHARLVEVRLHRSLTTARPVHLILDRLHRPRSCTHQNVMLRCIVCVSVVDHRVLLLLQ